MSPTSSNPVLDSSGHLPVETIADFLEDLLPAEAGAQLQAHLADCRDCRDTGAALEEVRSLLGQTGTPVLPADIGLRLDAALAAEALLGTEASEDAGTAGVAETARGADPDAAAAGTAPRKAHSAPSAPAGPLRPPAGPGRRRRWRRAALGVAALAAVGLISTAVLQSGGESGNSASSTSAKVPDRADSLAPVPFTDADLTQQVQQLLPTGPQGTALGPKALQQPAGGTADADATPVPCVVGATGRSGETPLVATPGVYRGAPVFLLVYNDTADPLHKVDAYLVSTSCATGGTRSPGAGVLLKRTVPRD
ncbi:zf-HC2 domain-containing protein [Streptacidiphilus sp. PAMC 29251]